jgi:hypothetical protein
MGKPRMKIAFIVVVASAAIYVRHLLLKIVEFKWVIHQVISTVPKRPKRAALC